MFSLADVFFYLETADPETLEGISDEIDRLLWEKANAEILSPTVRHREEPGDHL